MSVPTLSHAAVHAMFLPNRKGTAKRDNKRRAKVRAADGVQYAVHGDRRGRRSGSVHGCIIVLELLCMYKVGANVFDILKADMSLSVMSFFAQFSAYLGCTCGNAVS